MNGDFQFPIPQTEGRQRDLNTVAPDPNTGMVARPVRFQPQSLVTQVGDYVNNWLGNVATANRVKDTESLGMAAKVSSAPSGAFSTIVETYGRGDSPFETMADEFLVRLGLKVSSVEPGSQVPGRPVAPTTTNYQYANNIDKSLKKVASGVIEQVKGFFNIGYEGPVEPATSETPETTEQIRERWRKESEERMDALRNLPPTKAELPIIVILGIAYLLVTA